MTQREPFTCLYRGIWNDDKFWLRSELGQRIYIYILSTPLGNGLGCFRAGISAMAEDLRMSLERFTAGFGEGFDERLGEPLFLYEESARVVFVPKYIERNPPSNPNVIRALSKSFVTLPDCKLKYDCYHTVRAFAEGKGKAFVEAFLQTFAEPSSNHAPNLRQTLLPTFGKGPGIGIESYSPSCSLTLTRSAGGASNAPAPVFLELEDPRGYEDTWEWENIPGEFTDQLSANLSDVSYDLAVRLLWYWPTIGQQWAEQTAVQTLKLYVDKGLDVKLSLAQAAGKYHRSDTDINILRGQLASWMSRDLDKMKRGGGRANLEVVPEPVPAWRRQMDEMQEEWDRIHGKKPTAS